MGTAYLSHTHPLPNRAGKKSTPSCYHLSPLFLYFYISRSIAVSGQVHKITLVKAGLSIYFVESMEEVLPHALAGEIHKEAFIGAKKQKKRDGKE